MVILFLVLTKGQAYKGNFKNDHITALQTLATGLVSLQYEPWQRPASRNFENAQ